MDLIQKILFPQYGRKSENEERTRYMIMRMMKTNKNETIIVTGIDHGYGNMKTATRCFPSGVVRYEKEPIFQNNLLVYNGMYYQIGEEHKEFCAEKTQDDDYYVLTLAAIAK